MKLSLLFLVLWLPLVASTEKKIIIASFPTQQQADKALTIFESKLGSPFLAKQQESYFNIVARPSGKSYIIAIEPIESYREAVRIKKLLPWEYADAFINKYTPPQPDTLVEVAVPKTTQKLSPTPLNKPSSQKLEESQSITKIPSTVQSNIIESKQKDTNSSQVMTVTETTQSSIVTQKTPLTQIVTTHTKEPLSLFTSFLRLEYLLIGISVLTFILLLCFLRYYRKYHHLKKQFASKEANAHTTHVDNTPKSSDIFFVRQH